MTRYAAPGNEGSIVSYESRYDHYIGGEYVAPAKGGYFVNATPVTGRPFTEVSPPRRLAYTNVVDFVPGVEPYQIATLLELHELEGGGTRLVLTFDAMHDDRWTQLARLGHESELDRLAELLPG